MNFSLKRIPCRAEIGTLNWLGDDLVDLADGGRRFHLDGTITDSNLSWGGLDFDFAVVSHSGRYAALGQRLGTKCLLLEIQNSRPHLLRELNRSYYQSSVYEYPVAFVGGNEGELLLHCPEDYCRLEIEKVASTDFKLKHSGLEVRKPADFFHSRLTVSPSGKKFFSAGWVWHPFDTLALYDLDQALNNPTLLDKVECEGLENWSGEVNSATFLDDDHLVLAENSDSVRYGEDATGQTPGTIGILSLKEGRLLSKCCHDPAAGIMMPIDQEHIITFYQHPKIVHLPSGRIVASRPEIHTGVATSSIIHHHAPTPPLALDPERKRFAVAQGKEIVVVTVS
jgi:hypothetical protein